MKKYFKSFFLFSLCVFLLPVFGQAFDKWPDTGQTTSYTNTFGEDSDYNINPQSYSKLDTSGNDLHDNATSWAMIRDNVTGLIWEAKHNKDGTSNYANPNDADNKYTWCDANPATNGGNAGTCGAGTDTADFISALNNASYGGCSKWRVPTIKELSTIMNGEINVPSINQTFFSNTASSKYWSATTYAFINSKAWCVKFDYSGVDGKDKSNSYYVRAVCHGQPELSGDFVDNGDGTVTDTSKGLMWQKSTQTGLKSWESAISDCESLSLAGHDDWRLPNQNELLAIVDYSRYASAIDPVYFPYVDTVLSYYWSSTTWADYSDYAWVVYFAHGLTYQGSKAYATYYARAVRNDIHYYLPLFKPKPGHWAGLGVTNLNATEEANLEIKIYNQAGTLLITEIQILPANGQSGALIGTTQTENGWVEIISDQPLAGMGLLGEYKGTTSDCYLADIPFVEKLSKSLIIPHTGHNDGWDTVVYLANPNLAGATVTLTYTSKEGVDSTPYIATIPATGSKSVTVGTIANSTNVRKGYVTISSTQKITAFALYNNLKTGNFSYAGINAVDISTVCVAPNYYLPLFKPNPGYWAGLGVTNLNATEAANLEIKIYNQAGTLLITETQVLPANGQSGALIGTAQTENGWVKIVSDQPLAGMGLLGEYKGTTLDCYLADIPFVERLSQSLMIPHTGHNDSWDTVVYLANPNSTGASVTLTYTSKEGVDSTPYILNIPATGSKSVTVGNIACSTDVRKGYVTISSTQKITAFALYNNLKTGNFSYAGINAVDISKVD